jgi:uncharacterized membrane protein
VPGSAPIKLFDASNKLDLAGITSIKVPLVCGLPPAPVFVAEGKPAPPIEFTLTGTTVGPVRKLLVQRAVTRELKEATPDTAEAVIGRILADRSNASIDLIASAPAQATRQTYPACFTA